MINRKKTDGTNIGNKKFIVLVGLMGSGKTSLGIALAKLVNLPFIDSDSKVENISGKTITQLFDDSGELAFRKIEEMGIADKSRELDEVPMIEETTVEMTEPDRSETES